MKKLLAFVLALTLTLSLAACSLPTDGKSDEHSKFALSAAVLPEMAPYPNEMEYIDSKSGEFDDENFSIAYDAWWSDLRAQQKQYEGYDEGLDEFFIKEMRSFLTPNSGANEVISPLNIYMALGMLAETTDSSSREQILSAMGYDDIEALRKQANAIWNAAYRNDGPVTSVMAASLWLRDGVDYVQETMDIIAENYYADTFSGEMGSEEYDKALQSWLSEKTGGLLDKYASNEKFDKNTILSLATTIMYRAKWSSEFSENNTRPGTFNLMSPDGDTVTADFMNRSSTAHYYWGNKFSSVPLSLEGGSMWFILPDDGVTLTELLNDDEAMEFIFSGESWEGKKFLIVNMSVPKFDVSSKTDLTDGLKAMGITDVFNDEVSDFSPAVGDMEGVSLSKADHAARVTIDEEGVTAAAYTLMAMAGSAAPPDEEVDFVLDRPFMFVLKGRDGLPLFVGVVHSPV